MTRMLSSQISMKSKYLISRFTQRKSFRLPDLYATCSSDSQIHLNLLHFLRAQRQIGEFCDALKNNEYPREAIKEPTMSRPAASIVWKFSMSEPATSEVFLADSTFVGLQLV